MIARELFENVREAVSKHLSGMDEAVKVITIALLSRGHVLIEGVPGSAKTMLSKIFAVTLGLKFKRIQMTPDLLPSDIIGGKILDPKTGELRTVLGPIFTNVLLVDEVNRASPRTLSALIEAMQEGQVTIEGDTYKLPQPFFVIATMNPVEMVGTYVLPEVVKDRFTTSIDLRFPPREVEIEAVLLDSQRKGLEPKVEPIFNADEVKRAIEEAQGVQLQRIVAEYIVDLVRATRTKPKVLLGGSTRAAVHLARASKALAAMKGRDFVTTQDVKEVFMYVMTHKLVLDVPETRLFVTRDYAYEILGEILSEVEPPA